MGIRFLSIIFVVFISCSSVPKTIYKDEGLYFKVTDGFRIGKADTWKKNQSTYIPLYCRDKNIYAKFSVIWVPGNSNLDKEIQIYVDGLNSVYESDADNKPVFSEVKSTKFGSNIARQIDYVVANDGPRIGSYTTFHCNNITVIIGQHYTVEGQSIINRCRELIEQTYSCVQNESK